MNALKVNLSAKIQDDVENCAHLTLGRLISLFLITNMYLEKVLAMKSNDVRVFNKDVLTKGYETVYG